MSALPLSRAAGPLDDDLALEQVVQGLRQARIEWRERHRLREPRGRELPSAEALGEVIRGLRGALFPLHSGPPGGRLQAVRQNDSSTQPIGEPDVRQWAANGRRPWTDSRRRSGQSGVPFLYPPRDLIWPRKDSCDR